jgi:hypothetical protein
MSLVTVRSEAKEGLMNDDTIERQSQTRSVERRQWSEPTLKVLVIRRTASGQINFPAEGNDHVPMS